MIKKLTEFLLPLLLGVFMVFTGCTGNRKLEQGPWLGVICIDSIEQTLLVPFNMVYIPVAGGQSFFEVTNAGETILVTEFSIKGDSLYLRFPVFSAEILAVIRHDSMVGSYYPKGISAGTAYKFFALKGVEDRFPWYNGEPAGDVTGKWRITENPGTPDSVVMIGEFRQEPDGRVTGTVLSTGGDYRYLDGKIAGNRFMVSAVDGTHSLVFTAMLSGSGTLTDGRFLGSPKWKTTWTGVRDNNVRLPEQDALVKVKPGGGPVGFSFPDINGDTVSLSDPRFKGKVVILQAAGSWCPNCMDETVFFKELNQKYRDRGLEIVALCFEGPTLEASRQQIERFSLQTSAGYLFLYAGPRGRDALTRAFPYLEGTMAYPTTQFIDRKGVVRKVETGFSGPGTGDHYRQLTDKIVAFVEQLLAEP
jgi:thiol-disulfide isomerase/thioredoxin